MTADPDEEALAWSGETDPSHIEGPKPAVGKPKAGAGTTRVVELPADAAKPTTPAALLIAYGILGGVYLIYTLGWVITVQRLGAVRGASAELLTEIMFQFGEFLAIASPALWFAAVFLLTRGRKPFPRLLLLLIGVVVVLPWPFVLGAWA